MNEKNKILTQIVIFAILMLFTIIVIRFDNLTILNLLSFKISILIFSISLIILFGENNRIFWKINSFQVLFSIFIFIILTQITDLIELYFLYENNIIHARFFHISSLLVKSAIPFLIFLFIESYTNRKHRLITSIPFLFILMFDVTLIFVISPEFYFIKGIYEFKYTQPSDLNLIILIITYVFSGFFLLNKIWKSKEIQKDVILKINGIHFISLGILIYFIINPTFFIITEFHAFNSISFIWGYKFLEIVSLLLFIIPFIFDRFLFCNLIPQPIQKLLVINNAGLPILCYDFVKNKDAIWSNLIHSGSFRALVAKFSNFDENMELTELKIEQNQIQIKIDNDLIFILQKVHGTKILDDTFIEFTKKFSKVYNSDIQNNKVADNYFNEIKIKEFLYVFFAVEYVNPDKTKLDDKKEVLEKHTKNLIKLILTVFFSISSLRYMIFYISGSLLPDFPDFFANLPLVFTFFVGFVGILFGAFKEWKNTRQTLLFVNLIIYGIIGFVPTPWLLFFMILYLSSSWFLLINYVAYDAIYLSSIDKYRIFVSAIIMDFISRFSFLGTDPIILISFESNLYRIVIVISVIILTSKKFHVFKDYIPIVNNQNKRKISFISLHIILITRFALNPIAMIGYSDNPSMLIYFLQNLLFISILLISINEKVVNLIFNKYAIFFHIGLIVIAFWFYQSLISTLLLPLITISLVALAVLPEQFKFELFVENKKWLIVIIYYFTSIIFLAFVLIDYYFGFKMGITIVFLTVMLSKNTEIIPKESLLSKISKGKLLSILLFIFIIQSLLFPNYTVDTRNEQIDMSNIGFMTYNLQFGVNQNGEYNPHNVAKYVIESGVSFVAFQEITRSSLINGGGDLFLQLIELLRDAGFKYYKIMELNPEIITNVIFSKIEFQSVSVHYFENNEIYLKGYIESVLKINHTTITIYTTHLTHVYTEAGNKTRLSQVDYLLDNINLNTTSILLGDFNVIPNSIEFSKITTLFVDNWNNDSKGYTWPTIDPSQRIDYIFSRNISSNRTILDYVTYSDHLPLQSWYYFG